MTEEQTLLLIKPDAVANGHIGEIITRLERRRFTIRALQLVQATPDLLRAHYAQLVDRPYYPDIEAFMQRTPVVAMVLEGAGVVESIRLMTGATNPQEALPGTLRGDFARGWADGPIQNAVHSSDSVASAHREIALWFPSLTA